MLSLSASVTIRRIRPDDAQLLREIRLCALADAPTAFSSTHAREAAFGAEEWHRRANRQSSAPDAATFLAFDSGRCCGLIGCFGEDNEPGQACIVSMWVAPGHRRKGIAARLMQSAETWARDQGFERLSLDVTEGNQPAISLYEQCGFVFTGEFDRYPNDRNLRELFMVKQL